MVLNPVEWQAKLAPIMAAHKVGVNIANRKFWRYPQQALLMVNGFPIKLQNLQPVQVPKVPTEVGRPGIG